MRTQSVVSEREKKCLSVKKNFCDGTVILENLVS